MLRDSKLHSTAVLSIHHDNSGLSEAKRKMHVPPLGATGRTAREDKQGSHEELIQSLFRLG